MVAYVDMGESSADQQWALLVYRLPREPSTPRIALWRKLRRYGAFQLSDGVALLPATPRSREQLDWVAEDVVAAGGDAEVWIAVPGRLREHQRITSELNTAREREYRELTAAAHAAAQSGTDASRLLPTLRRRLRDITRRDYFAAPGRDAAEHALRDLAAHPGVTDQPSRR